MTDVVMPQMGESIVEGTLTKWLKKPGDRVERDEPLFEISTDKVDTEIPSPEAGVLAEVLVQEGTTVSINVVVGRISNGASAAPAPQPQAPPPPAPASTAVVQAAAPVNVPPPQPRQPEPPPPQMPGAAPGMRVEPMSNMRQKIAEHMVFSKRTSAHVTTVHKLDITKVAKIR